MPTTTLNIQYKMQGIVKELICNASPGKLYITAVALYPKTPIILELIGQIPPPSAQPILLTLYLTLAPEPGFLRRLYNTIDKFLGVTNPNYA